MNEMQLPPGLAGYVMAQQQNQQAGMNDIQQFGAIQGLMANAQKQQQEQAYRQELQSLGPNPTQEQLAGVASKYGGPDALMKAQQASIDKKSAAEAQAERQRATLEQQRLLAEAKLEQNSKFAEMMHEYRLSQAKTAEERAAETARHNKQIEAFQVQNAATMQELKRLGLQSQTDKAEAAKQGQIQKQTQQLGTALERAGLTEMDSVIRGVEDAMKKTPRLADYISGPLSATPDMAVGALTPGMTKAEADDIRAGRQAFQKLFNITLKNRSGAAVTNQELDRLKQEFAAGTFKDAKQLQAAVTQARNIITNHYRGIASGFGAETLNAYNSNMSEMGGTPLLEPRGAPAAPTGPAGGAKRLKFDANGNQI